MNHWDGHYPARRKLSVGRKLFTEKGTSHWEEIHRGKGAFSGKETVQWEERFQVRRKLPVGRELFTGKRAYQWKGSFSAREEPPIGKRSTGGSFLV